MPHSLLVMDGRVEALIRASDHRSFLDIGAGAGKYGRMIRAITPAAYIAAIEIDAGYPDIYDLAAVYDMIYGQSAQDFAAHNPDYTVDCAIIGDCIEHLPKSQGVDLIHWLVYRVRQLLVVFPTEFVQGAIDGHPHEAHVSVWDESDFRQFRYVFGSRRGMNLATIEGYRQPA